jgi:hypothetical protein
MYLVLFAWGNQKATNHPRRAPGVIQYAIFMSDSPTATDKYPLFGAEVAKVAGGV